jgi:DNA polymerase-3 subunit gamma/tau
MGDIGPQQAHYDVLSADEMLQPAATLPDPDPAPIPNPEPVPAPEPGPGPEPIPSPPSERAR